MIDLSEWSDLCGDVINYLEYVEVSVNLIYIFCGELLIRLMLFEGIVFNFIYYRVMDSVMGFIDLNWVFMILYYWGELVFGIWRLILGNLDLSYDNIGLLNNFIRNKYWCFLGFK